MIVFVTSLRGETSSITPLAYSLNLASVACYHSAKRHQGESLLFDDTEERL